MAEEEMVRGSRIREENGKYIVYIPKNPEESNTPKRKRDEEEETPKKRQCLF
jgi:hypothetical protein